MSTEPTPTPDSDDAKALGRAVRVGELIDLYGPLLTDRQLQFLRLHYGEDLSFGEIAQEFGVSRQAIHDAVKHGIQSLEEYDAKLGFGSKDIPDRRQGAEETARPAASEGVQQSGMTGLAPCIAALENIQDRLQRCGGVLYNPEGISSDLGAVLDRLRGLSED